MEFAGQLAASLFAAGRFLFDTAILNLQFVKQTWLESYHSAPAKKEFSTAESHQSRTVTKAETKKYLLTDIYVTLLY